VSKNPPELYKTIRAMINDPQGRAWSEEQIDVFIEEAGNRITFMTVSLMALSRGMFEGASRMAAWPGEPQKQISLTNAEVSQLATVFRDIFTKKMPDVWDKDMTPEGRLLMAESQIRAITRWNIPSESLNRIDEILKTD
jgi:hypothetical protein